MATDTFSSSSPSKSRSLLFEDETTTTTDDTTTGIDTQYDERQQQHLHTSPSDDISTTGSTTIHTTNHPPRPSPCTIQSFLILGNFLFGTGSVVGALGLPSCNPFAFALYREMTAGILLLFGSILLPLSRGQPYLLLPARKHWTRFAILGGMIFGNQAGFIVGLKLAGPVAASVWQPSQPIITAAISMILRWEALNYWRVLGVGVAFLGCALMVILSDGAAAAAGEGGGGGEAGHAFIGNIFFLINCTMMSIYVIMSKAALHMYPSLSVTAWSYNVASAYMALSAVLVSLSDAVMMYLCPDCTSTWGIPPGAIFALIYFIIFASVICYAILTWANKYATGTLVIGYTVLQPVTAALLTSLLLAVGMYPNCSSISADVDSVTACLDEPGWGTVCGMIGVFAGLYLVIKTEPSRDDEIAMEQELLDTDKLPLVENME